MDTIPKSHFLKLLKYRALSMIGKQILYGKFPQKIHDVSLDGNHILLDRASCGLEWYPADEVGDPVILDFVPMDSVTLWNEGERLTARTLTEDIGELKKNMGVPAIGQIGTLFETVDRLNGEIRSLKDEVQELREKIETIESKWATI